jgi:hypothetical protein
MGDKSSKQLSTVQAVFGPVRREGAKGREGRRMNHGESLRHNDSRRYVSLCRRASVVQNPGLRVCSLCPVWFAEYFARQLCTLFLHAFRKIRDSSWGKIEEFEDR